MTSNDNKDMRSSKTYLYKGVANLLKLMMFA